MTAPPWKVGDPLGLKHEGKSWDAEILKTDMANDIALLRVKGYTSPNVFQLDEKFSQSNTLLFCAELSRSSAAQEVIDHSTRMGNLVRLVNDKLFPPNSLELSFPALRGASGAPVFYIQNDELIACGIIKGNAAYELLPVEIYRVEDESEGKKIVETTKYCLPQGIAVHAKHLVKMIAEAE